MRQVLGSCPLDCPDTCSWIVTVEDGRATKLRGNPAHPISRGGLCAKVHPWLDYAADPGRLLHPLRRVGPKGAGRFERIGWDEAIDEIAERLGAIIDADGAAAIWPFVGTGNLGWIPKTSNTPGWCCCGAPTPWSPTSTSGRWSNGLEPGARRWSSSIRPARGLQPAPTPTWP